MASFGAYEDPYFDDEDNDPKEVLVCLSEIMQLFGNRAPFYLEEVTKPSFRSQAAKASLIHFHGHTTESGDNILERGIEVFSERETTNASDLNRSL
jgi:hypothetical protein